MTETIRNAIVRRGGGGGTAIVRVGGVDRGVGLVNGRGSVGLFRRHFHMPGVYTRSYHLREGGTFKEGIRKRGTVRYESV